MMLFRKGCLPFIVFDVELVSEVPMMISDEPDVKRIFRPGIVYKFARTTHRRCQVTEKDEEETAGARNLLSSIHYFSRSNQSKEKAEDERERERQRQRQSLPSNLYR
jgi:hypothetical protein